MRTRLMILLLVMAASSGHGFELGPTAPPKAPRDWPANPAGTARQGGDTVLEAIPITVAPFETTGTTTGYHDDYDEACPYTGSTAPDVVYALTLAHDQVIDIDMLGSTYDTKIYVYDQDAAVIACNDDFYPDYVSKLENVELEGGATYYLVIDGYGGSHGDYVLTIPPPALPCHVLAGCGAVLEQEPPLVDGYVDAHNGGCNSEEFGAPMSQLPPPDDLFVSEFGGTSGWFDRDGTSLRDTDWMWTTMPYTGHLRVEIESERPVYLFHLAPTDCQDVAVVDLILIDACERREMIVTGDPGATVWLWVGPPTFEPPAGSDDGEFRYRLALGYGLGASCLELGPGSDYSFGCAEVLVEDYEASYDAGGCVNDLDLADLCGTQLATPGGDVMASVYLEAGGSVGFQWHPFYYAQQDAARYHTCMALFDDLRPDRRSCIDVTCVSNINQFSSVSVDQPGWYWFVVDVGVEGPANEWGNIGFQNRGVAPPPPDHDDCEGAIALPAGPFVIHDDLSNATNRVDPGRDGCPDAPDVIFTSRDVVYEAALARGQVLDVTMSGMVGWDAQLYLVRDCEDPVGNCVAAGDQTPDGLRLTHQAFDDERLWLVCDSYGNGPRPFVLTGSIDDVTGAPSPPLSVMAVTAAPNPCNPATRITYDLPRAADVRLRVHDLRGRLVATLVDVVQPAGRHTTTWRGGDDLGRPLPSGSFVVRLEAGDEVRTTRVTVLK